MSEYRRLDILIDEYKENETYNAELEMKAEKVLRDNNVSYTGNAIYALEEWLGSIIVESDGE